MTKRKAQKPRKKKPARKRPVSIRILGHEYGISYDETLMRDREAQGMSCGNASWIILDPTGTEDTQASTLLHEVVEQLTYLLELGLEHRQITALSNGLFQVMKDNKLQF